MYLFEYLEFVFVLKVFFYFIQILFYVYFMVLFMKRLFIFQRFNFFILIFVKSVIVLISSIYCLSCWVLGNVYLSCFNNIEDKLFDIYCCYRVGVLLNLICVFMS